MMRGMPCIDGQLIDNFATPVLSAETCPRDDWLHSIHSGSICMAMDARPYVGPGNIPKATTDYLS